MLSVPCRSKLDPITSHPCLFLLSLRTQSRQWVSNNEVPEFCVDLLRDFTVEYNTQQTCSFLNPFTTIPTRDVPGSIFYRIPGNKAVFCRVRVPCNGCLTS